MPTSARGSDDLRFFHSKRRQAARYAGRRSESGSRRVVWSSGVAALFACLLTTHAPGAEQADSGWAVTTPTLNATAPQPTNPQLQIVLDDLLKQTHGPLLRTAPTPAAAASVHEPRVAERAADVDGWRPAGGLTGPFLRSPSAHAVNLPPTANSAGLPASEPNPPASAVELHGASLDFHVPQASSPPTNHTVKREASSAAKQEADCGDSAPPANARYSNSQPVDELSPELLPGGDAARHYDTFTEPVPIPPVEEPAAEAAENFSAETTPVDRPRGVERQEPKLKRSGPLMLEPTAPPQPLTPQLISLRSKLRGVLKGYYQKPLNSLENDPWEVMHGMLAYGVHSRIRQGGPKGDPITSVGWLCYNRPCKGQTLMYVTPEGELRAKQGVGLQGHMGQLLAMLAQCHVSPDYPIRVADHQFTIQDLIEAEQKTCYPKSELTFKLIALTHYLDLDATWVNDQGSEWDIPRLISEEIAQPIRGAACGGTHRLSGLSLAVKARQASGEPLDGEYAKAAEFVKNYQSYAFRLQNRDGSLSTKWFQGAGDESDLDRRIKTTGHILEWLVYSLSDAELRDQRTIRAVSYLTGIMYSNYDHEWEVGPVSHATHALILYDERVFQPFDQAVQGTATAPNRGTSPAKTTGSRGTAARR